MFETLTVGILGANGFIGSRLVEWLLLHDLAQVRPIVRSFKGMARLSRFDLDVRLAEGTDPVALEQALRGCDVLFHCVVGGHETILKSAEAAYRAAAGAGVRRLVYLSSAVVHGHHPAPGTHDDSPLIKKQPFAYNVSKVMAEELLHRLRSDRSVEVVTLRPSIVFGPRSQWTAGIAADLLEGRAYLIDGGSGICNTVYIDNLAQALWQAATSERAANQDFIITDGQKVTWRDLYDAMAEVVGVDIASVPSVESAAVAGILRQQKSAQRHAARNQIIGAIKQSLSPEFKRQVLRVLPLSITRTLRKWAASPPASPDSAGAGNSSGALLPRLDHEIVSLQQCRYVLPIQKAQSLLGYVPPFTFAEGCGKTAHWLRFAFGLASALGVY